MLMLMQVVQEWAAAAGACGVCEDSTHRGARQQVLTHPVCSAKTATEQDVCDLTSAALVGLHHGAWRVLQLVWGSLRQSPWRSACASAVAVVCAVCGESGPLLGTASLLQH
jgi:hypothetical protein